MAVLRHVSVQQRLRTLSQVRQLRPMAAAGSGSSGSSGQPGSHAECQQAAFISSQHNHGKQQWQFNCRCYHKLWQQASSQLLAQLLTSSKPTAGCRGPRPPRSGHCWRVRRGWAGGAPCSGGARTAARGSHCRLVREQPHWPSPAGSGAVPGGHGRTGCSGCERWGACGAA